METEIVKLTPELLAFIGSGGVNAMSPFTREIFLLNIVVAGTTFCKEMDEIYPSLLPDTKLKMVRHPKNEYDELAIGVYYNDVRIGWIPREMNEVISRLMDAGKAFFCRITDVSKKGTWTKIDAKVYMVE